MVTMVPRAERYVLQLPLQYRAVDTGEWQHSHTQNMSRSGVLFFSNDPLPLGAHIEVRLQLRGEEGLPWPVDILCGGRVVRQEGKQVAMQILHYRWLTTQAASQA